MKIINNTLAGESPAGTGIIVSNNTLGKLDSIFRETDFSEYDDGVPANWTDFWGTGDFTATVEANAGYIDFGTKWLKYETDADDHSVLTWDDLGVMSDVCMVTKIRTISDSSSGVALYLRVGGTAAHEDAYSLRINCAVTGVFKIWKHKDGALSNLVSKEIHGSVGTEFWVKFQAIGTTLKAKIWASDAIEPDEWHLETTDSDVASGAVGIGAYNNQQDVYVDYIGVDSSEIGLPVAFEDDIYFRSSNIPATWNANLDMSIAVGGHFNTPDRKLKGVSVWSATKHSAQIRIAVYSGGALATGPQGATLLKDFGQTVGVGIGQWVDLTTTDDISIPEGASLWMVVKGDSANFDAIRTNRAASCGDYQIARGQADVVSIIGKDDDVAFPATFPAGSASFSSYWYKFRILTEDVSGVTTTSTSTTSTSTTTSSTTSTTQTGTTSTSSTTTTTTITAPPAVARLVTFVISS